MITARIYKPAKTAMQSGKAGMKEWLKNKAASGHGNSQKYDRTQEDDPAMAAERALYKRYQDFFDILNESKGAA